MSTLTLKDIPLSAELSAAAARTIVGGNPALVRAAIAVAGYVGGKLIDGVVEDSGVLDPVVDYKSDGIYVGGKKLS